MSTVFALHGFTGSPQGFDSLAAALPQTRFVAPYVLGHGGENSARTFDEELDRLAALATDPDATLLGYSLGGRLALALLARGVRFARAVIVGAAIGLTSDQERSARREADARFVRILRTQGTDAFAEAWEAQPLFASQSRCSERRRTRRAHAPEGLARSLEVLGLAEMPYLLPALVRVSTPIDYLAGELDPKFIEVGQRLATEMSSVRLHVVKGAGHDVLLEAEGAVIEILKEERAG